MIMQDNQRSAPLVEDIQAGTNQSFWPGGNDYWRWLRYQHHRFTGASTDRADVVILHNTSKHESKRIKGKIEAAGDRSGGDLSSPD